MNSKVLELFGLSTDIPRDDWRQVVSSQNCPFIDKTCYKIRKSDPSTSIGTCLVSYSRESKRVVICPSRLLERRQIFLDCFHLLTNHEPGNEIHIVPEVAVPGGSVDYFLASAKKGKVRDFVGIELQTLDTTGTVWPERQRLLRELNVTRNDELEFSDKSFGMNWKMTAKTILVQMHHKVQTFEHVNRKLVLIVQNVLLAYMKREFHFAHLSEPALTGDAVHLHSYRLEAVKDKPYRIELDSRISTDADGVGRCLGLQADGRVELAQIIESLEGKISEATLFRAG